MTTPIAQGPVDVNVSPLPCPFCGKPMHENGEMDEDTLYPSGTGWKFDESLQMRTYHSFRDVPKEQWCWGLHCASTYGGCGAEMHGDTKADTLAKWNKRANVQAQGRCAALSRSVPWSAVLGHGMTRNCRPVSADFWKEIMAFSSQFSLGAKSRFHNS